MAGDFVFLSTCGVSEWDGRGERATVCVVCSAGFDITALFHVG